MEGSHLHASHPRRADHRKGGGAPLTIEAGRVVVVRVREGVDASLVEAVLRALKARS